MSEKSIQILDNAAILERDWQGLIRFICDVRKHTYHTKNSIYIVGNLRAALTLWRWIIIYKEYDKLMNKLTIKRNRFFSCIEPDYETMSLRIDGSTLLFICSDSSTLKNTLKSYDFSFVRLASQNLRPEKPQDWYLGES